MSDTRADLDWHLLKQHPDLPDPTHDPRFQGSADGEPFWCYPCTRGEHDACNGIAWQPDIECECDHDA